MKIRQNQATESGKRDSISSLNYVVFRPVSLKSGLSIFEAETYDAAVAVQQTIGNLVYYSNFGRYEPRIAKSWSQPSPNKWQFELNEGFRCENGEAITAESFRQSLLRSIKNQETRGGALVFRQLKGFGSFISGKSELEGIRATNKALTFEFEKPIRDGLLESLSYAPYGYLCAANFNSDGSWKDNSKLISSGPYRVESIEVGKKIVLVRRDDWMSPFAEGSPELISVTYDLPAKLDHSQNWIFDINRDKPENLDAKLVHFPLVPEFLSLMVLGNLKSGFFSKKENRLAFKERFEYRRAKDIPRGGELWTRADAFYPKRYFKMLWMRGQLAAAS